jgi:hypothetical protein
VLSAILGLRPKQTARKKKYGTNAATRVWTRSPSLKDSLISQLRQGRAC